MRLINSRTLELAEFVGDGIPPYAILSHTWGPGEVTFQAMQHPGRDRDRMEGFGKIQSCCNQAVKDSLDWVWVDTCCIDKTSSAELSEAINSMYRWYRDAYVCYVFLCDVPPLDPFLDSGAFSKARWFTRGWCLQELIAPRELEFYARDWTELGTKWSLQQQITDITAIPKAVLLHESKPSEHRVAERFSWASQRQTTRVEDVAYCLLGIFDVNMPMLYGEGRHAFARLQKKIMKRQIDYTIFLWSPMTNLSNQSAFSDSPRHFSVKGLPLADGSWCKYSDITLDPQRVVGRYERFRPIPYGGDWLDARDLYYERLVRSQTSGLPAMPPPHHRRH